SETGSSRKPSVPSSTRSTKRTFVRTPTASAKSGARWTRSPSFLPLFNSRSKHYYVIEGDLRSYFDTVHHRKLLSLLKRRIADRDILDLIWKFLKAGVMEDGLFAHTETGVPQGAIISPLLSNVYLHEFDKWAVE